MLEEKIRKDLEKVLSEEFLQDAFVEFVTKKLIEEFPDYDEETIRKIINEEMEEKLKDAD